MQVECFDLGTKNRRIAGGLRQEAGAGAEDHKDQPQVRPFGRQQPAAEALRGEHEGDGAGDPRQVIGGDHRQVQQRGQVTEQQVEAKKEDAPMRLTGVRVVPEPRPIRAFAHLGQIGGGVVGDEEEAGEMMARRGPEVGEQIGEERHGGDHHREDQREPQAPRARRRRRRRPR